MPRAKTTPFKTALTEHVHVVSDTKGRKVPAISVLWMPDAYSTITHNTYKNKSNDAEFCILFSTYIHHHIDPKNQKLVVNEGYNKNDTRVISKNIRHAPAIMEFFQEYEQYGKAEGKQMTTTIFDNPRKQDSSGFLTLSFNAGVEMDDMPDEMQNMQYLHVVNGLSPTTPSTGSSLVKSFPQTEFVFLEEDVDRYIQFIKDVAAYYSYMQEFNKEASSAKAVLRSSLKQRLDILTKKDQTMENGERSDSENTETKKLEKKKKIVEKKATEELPSTSTSTPAQSVKEVGNKKRTKKRQMKSLDSPEEGINEKKRKLTSLAIALENKKKEIMKNAAESPPKSVKKDTKKKSASKTGVIKEVTVIVDDNIQERGEQENGNGEEYEEEVEEVDGDEEGEGDVEESSSEEEEEGEEEED